MSINVDQYAPMLDRHFGPNSASCVGGKSNEVTAAINHADQFVDFKKNFDARLERLAKASNGVPALRNFIVGAANILGGARNWDGAFAELTALDYLLTCACVPASEIVPNKMSSAADTLADELGMTNVDHDAYLSSFDAYLDVKILSDKTGQILDGIVAEVVKKCKLPQLRVLHFFPADLSYSDVQGARQALVAELSAALTSSPKPDRVVSKVVPGVKFDPVWAHGVFMDEQSYSPSQHGNRHHRLMFQHVKKFHRTRPSFIILVHFPWASEKLPPLPGNSEAYFSAFSDAFFKDYVGSHQLANEFNSKFVTKIDCDAVTAALTGIVFLEDKLITSSIGGANINAYLSINGRNPFRMGPVTSFVASHTTVL
jgi:hypothetical protein